mgnify:CR=1 FL=1
MGDLYASALATTLAAASLPPSSRPALPSSAATSPALIGGSRSPPPVFGKPIGREAAADGDARGVRGGGVDAVVGGRGPWCGSVHVPPPERMDGQGGEWRAT